MFLFHFNCPRSFICQRIQTLNQTLTQSLFLLVKSFTELLKLVNRVKLHGTLICWVEDVLKHLCKSTSIFKFNQITIKFQNSLLKIHKLLIIHIHFLFFNQLKNFFLEIYCRIICYLNIFYVLNHLIILFINIFQGF